MLLYKAVQTAGSVQMSMHRVAVIKKSNSDLVFADVRIIREKNRSHRDLLTIANDRMN